KNDGKGYDVYTHGGRIRTNRKVLSWVKEAAALGAGEVLLTSMDTDGTKDGFDLQLNCMITSSVTIPVIASGGAGNHQHFLDVFEKGNVSAALAASIFHLRECSIRELKEYLHEAGVAIRI
ncbi:MAG: HisA/HisF-related TIM barrel protein, partial [Candidatus Thorarchaeota archaeon]